MQLYTSKPMKHTTSIQDQEEPQRNTSVEATHLHATITSRQNIRKPFMYV
jgi:hypothetical protein